MPFIELLIAASLSSNARHADVPDHIANHPRIVEGEASRPAGTFYVEGYAAPGGAERDIVQFYALRDPSDDSPEGVPYVSIPIARRTHESAAGGSHDVLWADGRTCPQLYGVMAEFSRLAAPTFSVPQFTPEPIGASRMGPVSISVHAPVLSIWGYARQADGVRMSMTLSGTDGLIARWVSWTEAQLSDCWRPAPSANE